MPGDCSDKCRLPWHILHPSFLLIFLGADFLCLCPVDNWLSEAASGGVVFLDAIGGMVVVGVCVRSEGVCEQQ